MKRMIVAIVLIVLLIAGCFWGYSRLDLLTQEVASHISIADSLHDEQKDAEASDTLQDAYALWRNRQPVLGAIVRHDELDDIENLFLRAMQSLSDRESAEYRLQSRELKGMLLHIPEMERPSVQNIF